MSHVFLPSDPKLKRLAVADRGGAQPRARVRVGGRGGRRARRALRDRRGRSARCGRRARRDEDVLQTTSPGDALQLFADPTPPALAAFTVVTPAAAGPAEPETAFERRERLRAERHALVALDRAHDRRGARAGQRPHQPPGRCGVGQQVDRRSARAGEPAARERGQAPPADGRAPGLARRDGRGALDRGGGAARHSRSRPCAARAADDRVRAGAFGASRWRGCGRTRAAR